MLKRSLIWFSVSAFTLLGLCVIVHMRQHRDVAKHNYTSRDPSDVPNVDGKHGEGKNSQTLVGSPLLSECKFSEHGVNDDALRMLNKHHAESVEFFQASQIASDKNQVMDRLLSQPQIPTDYSETMIALFRDSSQDVVTRDFAVQHIGLYAQALNRRGQYDPKSAEAEKCRSALFDAASETETIVAAAAFRALSDVSEFDSSINVRRLNNALVRCASDESAPLAARIMAVQLCGERMVKESKESLRPIASSSSAPKPLRLAAKHSIERL